MNLRGGVMKAELNGSTFVTPPFRIARSIP